MTKQKTISEGKKEGSGSNHRSGRWSWSIFRSLNTKVTGYVLVLLAAAIVCSYYVTIRIMNYGLKESIIRRTESLSRSLASAAGYHLILQDLLALDNMVYKVKTANPDITSIAIIGQNQEIVVHSDPEKAGTKLNVPATGLTLTGMDDGTKLWSYNHGLNQTLIIESPITFMEKGLGSVRLEVDWSVLRSAQVQARQRIIPIFALIMVLGFVASFLISRRLTKPVRELARGVEDMKHNGRSQPLRVYSLDELGQLTASFNEMTFL
ncbi:MAG: HAMP domain-containing protein, partial [Candidatus Saccharicenans sp.]